MSVSYLSCTSNFQTMIDFWRFGISEAHRHELYFGHGTDNAVSEFLALMLGSLNLPIDIDPLMYQTQLTIQEKEVLAEQLTKRIHDRIPVPYLTHEAFFCGLSFYVDERVLIPRSPIAEMIDQQFSPWIDPENVERILDLCTGSGCIAIACGYAFPDALVDAVDISTDALDVAEINWERHYREKDQVNFICSDCWENVPEVRYDIIVSNPPYVGDEEMAELPQEYLHEPDMALRANNNGLAIVDKILARAHQFLTPEGILVVEVGNSADSLIAAYPALSFTWIEFEQGGDGVFILTYDQLASYFEG